MVARRHGGTQTLFAAPAPAISRDDELLMSDADQFGEDDETALPPETEIDEE